MTEEIQKQFKDDFNDEDQIESKFHNFKEPGKEIVLGIVDKFDETGNPVVMTVNTMAGEVNIRLVTALKDNFDRSDIGKKIKIIYTGEKQTGKPNPYMTFEIFKKDFHPEI